MMGEKLLSLPQTVTARAPACKGYAYMCIYYFFEKGFTKLVEIPCLEKFAQELCKYLKFPLLSWICQLYCLNIGTVISVNGRIKTPKPTSEHHPKQRPRVGSLYPPFLKQKGYQELPMVPQCGETN